jgi:hypothetical protein
MPSSLRRALALLPLALLGAAPAAAAAPELEPVASFSAPTYVTSPPGDPRLFVTERAGVVRIVGRDGAVKPAPFLDITSHTTTLGERGLLSIAFPPDYAASGLAYVFVTGADGALEIREFHRSAGDPNRADPGLGRLVLSQAHASFSSHNGGQLQFDAGGRLYAGFGDGGSRYDPSGNAQNLDTLLGKLIRIDPRTTAAGAPYAIPPGNPFAGATAGRDEVWASGLRNPYRFSFDRQTGDLWLGDVGQDTREEVDRAAAGIGGQNYGWRCYEGTIQTPTVDPPCDPPGDVPPLFDLPPAGRRGLLDHGRLRRPRPRAADAGRPLSLRRPVQAGDPVRRRGRQSRHRNRPVRQHPRVVRAGRLRPALHGLARQADLTDPRRRLDALRPARAAARPRPPRPASARPPSPPPPTAPRRG